MKFQVALVSLFLVIAPVLGQNVHARARSLLTATKLGNGADLRVNIVPSPPIVVDGTCTAPTTFVATVDVGTTKDVTYIFVMHRSTTGTYADIKDSFTKLADEVFNKGSALNGGVVRFSNGASASNLLDGASTVKDAISANCNAALTLVTNLVTASAAKTVVVLLASGAECATTGNPATQATALANTSNKKVIIETIAISVGCSGILGNLPKNGGKCNAVTSASALNINTIIGTTLTDVAYKLSATVPTSFTTMPSTDTPGPTTKTFSTQPITIGLGANELCVKATGSDEVGKQTVEVSECIIIQGTDKSAPTITCPGPIVRTADLGMCKSNLPISPAPAFDNCDGTLVALPNQTTSFLVGTTPIAFEVFDKSNNKGSCETTVTVADNQAPTITTCPAQITRTTAQNTCTVDVDVGALVEASDNCDAELDLVANFTESFPKGSTSVKVGVTDGSGNTGFCETTVTVADNQAPTITSCPAQITRTTAQNTCTVDVDVGALVEASDNCDAELDLVANFTESFPKGSTSVKVDVTDGSGNTGFCETTVTVADNQAPTITTCPAQITRTTAQNTCTVDVDVGALVEASDNCDAELDLVANFTESFPKGSTSVKVGVTDGSGNTGFCETTVTVADNQAPTITSCPAQITRTTAQNTCTVDVDVGALVEASDNCDAELDLVANFTESFPKGSTSVKVDVTDGSGNTGFCETTVTVADNQAPTITTCPAQITRTTAPNTCTVDVDVGALVEASDNCDAELDLVANFTESFPKGSTSVKVDVTDGSGNTGFCETTVTVADNQAPTITCPNALTIGTDSGVCYATIQVPNASATDNCDQTLIFSNNAPSLFSLGTTTITHQVKDASDNEETCTSNVMVADYEKPMPTCTLNNAVDANVFKLGGSDNCGITGNFFVVDLTSKKEFGPYTSGTVFKYVQNSRATTIPSANTVNGLLTITGRGPGQVRVKDLSGNEGASNCNPRNSRLLRGI